VKDVVGYVVLGLIGVSIVGGLLTAGMSVGDIRRYMKIRKM
jgi:hypothetical protein